MSLGEYCMGKTCAPLGITRKGVIIMNIPTNFKLFRRLKVTVVLTINKLVI